MRFFQRARRASASLLFRGGLSAPAESFRSLQSQGIEVRDLAAPDGCRWALSLSHPSWGAATLSAPRQPVLPDADIVGLQWGLDDDERRGFLEAGHELRLEADASRKHVLRDRKQMLRWARLLMGNDGVGLLDVTAQLFWSVARLDEELSHDADLDISAVYCLHAVGSGDGSRCDWLHSHGLAELGAFDFDVLRPSGSVMNVVDDVARALAFAIVEGELAESQERFALAWPGGDIRMVPAAEFQARAPQSERDLRDDEHHDVRRAVACEPAGFVSRLLGSSVRASRFLSAELPENSVFAFSGQASELMADRARLTVGVLASLHAEFAGLELPTLLKLGCETTAGGTEHLWFRLHELGDGRADLTLINSPHDVPSLREGMRSWHDLSRLTDWTILSPAGNMTPRDVFPARVIRRDRPAIERILRESRA